MALALFVGIGVACVALALFVGIGVACGGAGAPSSSASTTHSTTPTEVIEDPVVVAQRSVVMVVVSRRGTPIGSGSGVIAQDALHVITNFHVVTAGDSYDVVLAPPGKARVATSAVLVDYDEVRDLAILKLKEEVGVPVRMAPQPPSLGEPLLIAGYPGVGGDTLTVTKGYVSGFFDKEDGLGDAWIKTDATINHGNSGGGAFDSSGRLVASRHSLFG